MKTDELVSLLAANVTSENPNAGARRLGMALGWGGLAAALLMSVTFGVRSDLGALALLPMFWMKLAFTANLAIVGGFAVERLSRPGMRLGGVWVGLVVPVLLMWLVGLWAFASAEPDQRQALVFGRSWASCLLKITLVSLPVLMGVFWAMKGLAPTRLALAGAAAGLLAGAVGGFVYAFHCHEMAAPFVGTWYLGSMALLALAGSLLGPRLLHW
ncbi:DUF1109 domain-containing protein [Polaromonas jejuensis]|uniref:DUF1109 domain-containing protein n=1 Tax=Polaromonas jejuensis TaxID=457502 RepID=A0ABW0QIR5_9BURK|nr:DUF1109 domain-containing protein [Polaromonas jejuensis]